MYRQNIDLLKLLEPVVRGLGYELLGIERHNSGRDSLLRIYIDSTAGISLLDCERVSRQVTGILDVNDPIKGPYHLEVSSPGFDRPLFTLEQFKRYIGHNARLCLHNKIAGRRRISGVISSVNDDSVDIMMDETNYRITADNIDKARLVVD
jgi:ribosome maturation factor RimP